MTPEQVAFAIESIKSKLPGAKIYILLRNGDNVMCYPDEIEYVGPLLKVQTTRGGETYTVHRLYFLDSDGIVAIEGKVVKDKNEGGGEE